MAFHFLRKISRLGKDILRRTFMIYLHQVLSNLQVCKNSFIVLKTKSPLLQNLRRKKGTILFLVWCLEICEARFKETKFNRSNSTSHLLQTTIAGRTGVVEKENLHKEKSMEIITHIMMTIPHFVIMFINFCCL